MLPTLIQNVALLIAIVVVYQFFVQDWHGNNWRFAGILGLLFGAAGIVSMMTPYQFSSGVVIDGRSIILAVAGFFGGPAVAVIAAAICATYRLFMGGAGTQVGIAVIAASALLGVIFYHRRQRDERVTRLPSLWFFGFLVHLVMVAFLWLVPGEGWELVGQTGAIILLLFPPATVLACKVFLVREKQKDIERKLFASEERHRTTLMSIGDAVISTDSEGKVVLMNGVAEALTGWRQDEATGRPLEDVFNIVSEDSRKVVDNPAKRVLKEGIVVGLANHTLLLSRDGTERPVADSAAPIKDNTGNLSGVVLVFRDQTTAREAEQALQESERRLADLMSHLPGMVYRCKNEPTWPLEFISDGCKELTGFSADKFGFDSSIHSDDRNRVWEETQEAVRENRPFRLNYRMVTADNRIKWVEERGRTLSGGDQGDAPLLQGFIFDITEQKEMEREKERLEEELRQAHKMEAVGRLAGGVAHDFNNMLSVINGYTEMALASSPVDAETRECLAAIEEAGRRSANLTQQLLAFARKQAIAPKVLDVNKTLDGMLDMLRRLIGEDIEVVWQPGAGVFSIKIDPAQLDQIMINLVINARDAIETHGKIVISTENFILEGWQTTPVKNMPPDSYALISISDDGRGMDDRALLHVFEPFFTTKANGKGTGLGLATVYGIASQNGGFVGASSAPGEGAVFRVYLPCIETSDTPQVPPTASSTLPKGTETLLLVEDEESILKLNRTHLEKLGYDVLTAGSPNAAIQIARECEKPIDLLVTDVIMPEMNGRDLWLELSNDRDLRCLYISGYTADIIQERGILFEDVIFLQKPFTLEALAYKVREALSASPSRRSGTIR